MPHNLPPASPWQSEIPILTDTGSGVGNYKPHVQLDENLRFDIVLGPAQSDPFSRQAVYIPEITEGKQAMPSPDFVAVGNKRLETIALDAYGKRAAQEFWASLDAVAEFVGADELAEDKSARAMGITALIGVSPTGRQELNDGGYRFEVSTQGIVIATARTLVQRWRFESIYGR